MSEASKKPTREKLVTVGVKVRPIERLALEQRAAEGNTTMSRVARQAILRGLNATKEST
jgi:hypothetical protein